jgi:polyisoprenoid-binding protein YceI
VTVSRAGAPPSRPWPVNAWQRAAALGEVALDGQNAIVTFAVRWVGAIVVRGRFHDVQGVLRLPEGDVSRAEVQVDVGAASVRTGIGLRDRHLCGPSFLDVARHPRMSFRTTGVSVQAPDLDLRALVTVRGVTAAGRLECSTFDADGLALHVVGTGTLSRRAFHVGTPGGLAALNPLYWLIGDRVQVRAEVVITL